MADGISAFCRERLTIVIHLKNVSFREMRSPNNCVIETTLPRHECPPVQLSQVLPPFTVTHLLLRHVYNRTILLDMATALSIVPTVEPPYQDVWTGVSRSAVPPACALATGLTTPSFSLSNKVGQSKNCRHFPLHRL